MNQAINFFWTILCFIPVVGFWFSTGVSILLYVFIGMSILSLLIPAGIFQLSINPKFYERLGVKFIRKLVQGGDIANRLSRKKNPKHKIIKNRTHATSYQRTIVMYERYHFACFIFFLLSAIYSIITHAHVFFIIILLANIIYNICPVLLQQYNRARVLRVINKAGHKL